jgi:uncharacterized protein (DUF1684 family)
MTGENGGESARERLDLLDWKRRVFALYGEVRAADDPEAAWHAWRSGRDELFASHPQSPLSGESRRRFASLDFFPYEPALRVEAEVVSCTPEATRIAGSGPEPFAFTRFAEARFVLEGRELALELYWLDGYGGGVFLPFRDATSGAETYGGGRYLLDTVKGSDLGEREGRLILDFNFAYNPSCSYDPRWACPLCPPANRLGAAIPAGERHAGSLEANR